MGKGERIDGRTEEQKRAGTSKEGQRGARTGREEQVNE